MKSPYPNGREGSREASGAAGNAEESLGW